MDIRGVYELFLHLEQVAKYVLFIYFANYTKHHPRNDI